MSTICERADVATGGVGVEYALRDSPTRGAKRRIVPPRPAAPGERRLCIYGPDDLDSLVATVWLLNPLGIVSLVRPPFNRITTWPVLKAFLMRFKARLRYLHKRRGFPKMVATTEFDPVEPGSADVAANFHVGVSAPLTPAQRDCLRDWWLDDAGLPNNQGGSFDYRSEGGGRRLEDYLPKDMDKRGVWRHVKFRPDWIPETADMRLWFCVGLSRGRAPDGRRIRRLRRAPRRRPFYRVQPITSRTTVSVQTVSLTVTTTGVFSPLLETFQTSQSHCPVCWTRWGRSLRAGECICSGHVELSRRCPTLSNL